MLDLVDELLLICGFDCMSEPEGFGEGLLAFGRLAGCHEGLAEDGLNVG